MQLLSGQVFPSVQCVHFQFLVELKILFQFAKMQLTVFVHLICRTVIELLFGLVEAVFVAPRSEELGIAT